MGIPLAAATQWDLVNGGANNIAPAHEELLNQAAQSTVVYNDDTTMKVLQLTKAQRAAALADDVKGERTGIFTSGIVATQDGRKIALFFTGVRHAGENLNAVLARRRADLPPPIQMADGLSRNVPSDFDTILGSCLAHARRKHAELMECFPEQVRFVLETLREIYITDARARKAGLDPQQRLKLHQEENQPRMKALEQWMQTQFTERIIEPNSSLGAAILYMQKRWPQLTLFLRIAGAPLDSNIVERALKKAILHRKAAMFYKTLNGARVGDMFMSLIYTAELNEVPAFEYLVALLQHVHQVRVSPSDWMPWNYQSALSRLIAGPDPLESALLS
jgi:transposase